MRRDQATLTELARLGFASLSGVRAQLDELFDALPLDVDDLLPAFARAADPDQALRSLVGLARSHPDAVSAVLGDGEQRVPLIRLLGASVGLADFFHRHPAELQAFAAWNGGLPTRDDLVADLLESVGAVDGFATTGDDEGYTKLR